MRLLVVNTVLRPEFARLRAANPGRIQQYPVVGGRQIPPNGRAVFEDVTIGLLEQIEPLQAVGCLQATVLGGAERNPPIEKLKRALGWAPPEPAVEATPEVEIPVVTEPAVEEAPAPAVVEPPPAEVTPDPAPAAGEQPPAPVVPETPPPAAQDAGPGAEVLAAIQAAKAKTLIAAIDILNIDRATSGKTKDELRAILLEELARGDQDPALIEKAIAALSAA